MAKIFLGAERKKIRETNDLWTILFTTDFNLKIFILFQTFDKSFVNWEIWQNICVQILEQICTESCEIKQQQY